MKTIFMLLLVLVPFSVMHAQERRDTVHYKPVEKTARLKMKQDLGLSREQAKGLKSIQKQFKQQMQELQGNPSLSQDEKRTRLRGMNNQRAQKIAALLSPEQLQKLQALKEERRQEKMQE